MKYSDRLVAYRIAASFLSMAAAVDLWATWNLLFLRRYLRISHDYFPYPFDEPAAHFIAIVLLVLSCLFVLFSRADAILRLHAGGCFVLSLFLCCSLATHHDAAFVTALWTSVWLLWLANSSDVEWQGAMVLAGLIISSTFLLAAVGKTTEAYLSGRAFYELNLYVHHYDWARFVFSFGESYAELFFRWYSRFVVLGEFLIALFILLPLRIMARVYIVALILMLCGSHYSVFAATGSFIGMLIAGEYLRSRSPR